MLEVLGTPSMHLLPKNGSVDVERERGRERGLKATKALALYCCVCALYVSRSRTE